MYATTLGAITAIGGANLPPQLQLLVEGVGINLLSSIIASVACGENIPDDKLQREVESAIQASNIEQLLTRNEFYRAIAGLKRGQEKVAHTVHDTRFDLIQKLDEILSLVREQHSPVTESEVPLLPCCVHPYTLSTTHGFVGRRAELKRLTEWTAHPNEPAIR